MPSPRMVVLFGLGIATLPFVVRFGGRVAAASQDTPFAFIGVGVMVALAGLFLQFLDSKPQNSADGSGSDG